MNTDKHGLRHSGITQRIIGVFYQVYNELGYGFLESVYVEALAVALHEAGLRVERELPLSVRFRGRVIAKFRADLVIAGAVLIEVKACSRLQLIHHAQVLNYLRATVLEVGLLLNFGPRPVSKDCCSTTITSTSRECLDNWTLLRVKRNLCSSVFIRGKPQIN